MTGYHAMLKTALPRPMYMLECTHEHSERKKQKL